MPILFVHFVSFLPLKYSCDHNSRTMAEISFQKKWERWLRR
jgi:hypothetical protein